MALDLHRPTRPRVRIAGASTDQGPVWLPATIAALGRLLLVGFAVGIFLMTGPGVASIAFVGVIALGAAMSGWER